MRGAAAEARKLARLYLEQTLYLIAIVAIFG